MEREQHQTEIRDLQDQLSEMHDELDSAKRSEDREKGALIEVRKVVVAGMWDQVVRQAPSAWGGWDGAGWGGSVCVVWILQAVFHYVHLLRCAYG